MEKWCIGIDLGGTFIKFGLLNSHYQSGETLQLRTPADEGPTAVIEQMAAGARELISKHGLSSSDVLGVGIGSPGPLRISDGIIIGMPNIEGMANVPIRDEISGRLSIPAVLENDANAAAYGEYICEAGRGAGNLVLLTLGTGVGCGVIIDGKILHGSHGIGAELGHMMIVPDGEQCGCGQRGCLERYCSATYIAQGAQRLIEQEQRESSLKNVLAAKGTIDTKDINEAHKGGDQLAAQVWDRATYYLAMGLVNVCRLFDPDRIVLAGGLANAGDDLMLPLQEHFHRLRWSLAEPMTKIVFSRLGNDAGVIGAAGVAWQEFAPARS